MRKRRQYAKNKTVPFSNIPTLIAMIIALVMILLGGKYLSQMVAEGFVPDAPTLDDIALENQVIDATALPDKPVRSVEVTPDGLLSRHLSRAFMHGSTELLDMIAKGQNHDAY